MSQIDPKRAIPREEQERTAKIFVGGVSQECTDSEFKEFFEQFGRVLDATLMMDKDTGRPRGFGFVTFDSDAAVDRVLAQDHEIHNKWIEVKRAEPRGNVRDGEGGHGKFGRPNRGGGNFGNNDNSRQNDSGGNGGNTMSASQAAAYWQTMQNYFKQMQAMTANANGPAMNPMAAMQQQAMMQQMMQAQRGGQMNPAMMQQMANMQGNMQGGGYPGMPNPGSPMGGGSPMNGDAASRPAFNAQEYERQQNVRMQSGSFQGGITWEGMYDDVPPPNSMRGRGDMRGIGYGGRGGRGGG
jgi:RNA-binding protein Musashi